MLHALVQLMLVRSCLPNHLAHMWLQGGCALPAVNLHCVTLVPAGLRVTSVAASGTCIWAGTEDGQLLLVHLPT